MMTVPLVILAVGAALAGLIGIPKGMLFNLADLNIFHHFLEPVVAEIPVHGEHGGHEAHLSLGIEWLLNHPEIGDDVATECMIETLTL